MHAAELLTSSNGEALRRLLPVTLLPFEPEWLVTPPYQRNNVKEGSFPNFQFSRLPVFQFFSRE